MHAGPSRVPAAAIECRFAILPLDVRVEPRRRTVSRTAPAPIRGEVIMGRIAVHEFIALDGVMDNPTWTFEYGFDPKMGEAIAAFMSPCKAILLGRRTYEQFAPAWSTR